MRCFTNLLLLQKETQVEPSQAGGRFRSPTTPKVGAVRKTEAAAKFVLEGEGRAIEGWTVFPEHLKHTCTDFDPLLLDALVKDG